MEPLPEAPLPLPNDAPHLLERLAAEQPGQRIQTSVRQALQRQTQALVNRYAREYSSNHIHNLAAIVADVETGEVLAYAGNATYPADERRGNQVDIITSPRSTGSILKPFLYAGMLHDGLLLPSMLVSDVPLNINGFSPHNYNKTFYGAVPAHVAIERSLNVPLVRMLSQYNTGRFMSLLKSWGMTTLRFSEEHYGASLILGGAEGTLWDLSGMYASMSRVLKHYRTYNGRYNPADIHPLTPFPAERKEPIRSLTDSRLTDKALLSSAALWYTFEAMSALNRPEEEADWQQFESMKRIAWKTGTSYGGRDAWAIARLPATSSAYGPVTLPARAVQDLRVSATPPRSFSISFPYCPVANGSTCPTMRRFPWRSAGTADIKPRPTASKRTPYTCRCPAITRGFAPTISSCIYRRTDGTGSIVPASLSTG